MEVVVTTGLLEV